MTIADRALLLSLRPMYAEMILAGRKSVELRRIRPRAEAGTLVVVYASSPVRHVLGTCRVIDITEAAPTAIWNLHGPQTGIGRATFRDYFHGVDRGVAISVGAPHRLASPVSLDEMRDLSVTLEPPQSFRYIASEVAAALLGPAWVDHLESLGALGHAPAASLI